MKKLIISTIATISLLLAQSNDPFEQMDKMFQMQLKQMQLMQKQMDAMFNEFSKMGMSNTSVPMIMSSGGVISTGVKDKGDYYEVDINVGKGDIKADVKAENGMLTIKVEQKQEKKESNSTFGVIQSYSSSSFMQSFTLPKDADTNSIDYNIKDGKMIVKIKKVKK